MNYRYYAFDDAVIRELLGKKLSSRHRKDLDEVSEKTHVQLKSCRFVSQKESDQHQLKISFLKRLIYVYLPFLLMCTIIFKWVLF